MAGQKLNLDLVKIEWEDSRQGTTDWVQFSEFEDLGVCHCVTVGWLYLEKPRYKIILPDLSDIHSDDPLYANSIYIPNSAILDIKIIEPKREES